ncbi:MAG: hypothetical protein LQ350_001331 [Teloschistes chrysophthalmus]|nr:MAG: hypothetical protein LQ350_001331 [Niorma chrysophthalma]
MPDTSILGSLAPYHILTYGTLLGSAVFQSFIGGVVAFRSLPRPQFSSLQSAIFPIYFSLQTALPVLLALTYPASSTSAKSKLLGSSLGGGGRVGGANGFSGVFASENRWSVLLPIATVFGINLLNLTYVGPATTRIMRERKHQETRDNKRSYDPPPHSAAMQKLNRRFGIMHGASSGLNLVSLVAIVGYGFTLGGRMQ